MARLPKKTVRKLVTLPLETAEWAEQFRIKSGATSESDAFKMLIESGLQRFETKDGLFARCEAATAAGKSIGDVINFLADHPLISSTTHRPQHRKRFIDCRSILRRRSRTTLLGPLNLYDPSDIDDGTRAGNELGAAAGIT